MNEFYLLRLVVPPSNPRDAPRVQWFPLTSESKVTLLMRQLHPTVRAKCMVLTVDDSVLNWREYLPDVGPPCGTCGAVGDEPCVDRIGQNYPRGYHHTNRPEFQVHEEYAA